MLPGAQFSAISMISLTGIIERNSILLVCGNRPASRWRTPAMAARAPPIVLTGPPAMSGVLFIRDNPTFNGLAIALTFGILVARLLTLVATARLYQPACRRVEKSQPEQALAL